MEFLFEKGLEAAQYIKDTKGNLPKKCIQLGTGLTHVIDQIVWSIPYAQIPHFPSNDLEGHKGELQLAKIGSEELLVLSGRFHYYEGYSMQELTFPIRVLKALGISELIITNVAGSLNPNYQAGDLIFINDHINFFPDSPLRGLNDNRLGIRFPDMKNAYHPSLLLKAKKTWNALYSNFTSGVYFGLQGPSLETKAEYNFIHKAEADLVGMSTVPEIIVAKQCELPTLAISCVSNVCYPIEDITETTIEEVIQVVQQSVPKLKAFLEAYLK